MASYVIDGPQKEQLSTDGYVLLPAPPPPALLSRLRDMTDQSKAEALAEHKAGRASGNAAIFDTADGVVVERLDKILEADAETVLDLLACPAMMAVTRELCGYGTCQSRWTCS